MRPHTRYLLVTLLASAGGLAGCATTTTSPSNDQVVSDSTISANVKAALVQDPITRASNISVNTIDGTVELSGFVTTPDQRREAVRVTRNIGGVQSIRNELSVSDQGEVVVGSVVPDGAITHRVEEELASSPQTADARINVATADGVVQLAGFVNSNEERDAAGDIASSVRGVRKVDNDLRINPGD